LKGVVERTKAGLERARRAGKKIGRPRRLQFTCELRDDVPALGRRRALDCHGEKVFDRSGNRNFVWPNADQLTWTYVDSRKVIVARVQRELTRIR
jgi:hypothetical protein